MKFIKFTLILTCQVPLLGCTNTVVSETYANIGEARTDGAIARGWLPAWLPASTTNIIERHDLDTNRSATIFQTKYADRIVFAKFCEKTNDYKPPIYFKSEFNNIKQDADDVLSCGGQFALLGRQKIMMWRD